MERKITLAAPIPSHNGEITELTLKLPRARAWIQYGAPFTTIYEGTGTDAKQELRFNSKAMLSFLSDMSGVSASDLELLDGRDFHSLMYTVVAMVNGASPT